MHTLSELEQGKLAGIKRLNLTHANLTHFPMAILDLADTLEVLDLSHNQLKSLPSEIKQLHRLKILFASNNPFEELPESLGLCPKLEMVGFKSNNITRVSEEALPKQLRWLILTDNAIEQLPESLGERPRLQKLALAGNQLTQLPQSLAKAHNLELIRISANRLESFPNQLLTLPRLAWIAFAGNPFCQAKRTEVCVPEVSSSSYTLQQVLGQGASGVISQALWHSDELELPEDIAVKVFKGEITSDGYPSDELDACLKAGHHPNLVRSLAQVKEDHCLALIMDLIPKHYDNLGLPPSLESCTRDTFPEGFSLSIEQIDKIVQQMRDLFSHLHQRYICHGDLYAHNTLIDKEANIIFGDFGASSIYDMLDKNQQEKIKTIEGRALGYFIEDLLGICAIKDQSSELFAQLKKSCLAKTA